MASNSVRWIWSAPHNDYFYVTYNDQNEAVYHWGKGQQAGVQPVTENVEDAPNAQGDTGAGAAAQQQLTSHGSAPESSYYQSQAYIDQLQYTQWQGNRRQTQHPYGGHQPQPAAYPSYQQPANGEYNQQGGQSTYPTGRNRDSGYGVDPDNNAAQMPPPITEDLRPRLRNRNLVEGTPQRGWYERLDSTYRVRTGHEAREFFVQGRVFAVLWAEAASARDARRANPHEGTVASFRNPSYTEGRFGEKVYSNIRRFVVVTVKRRDHFVYAIPITTYSGRGTTKPNCNPKEHAIAYFTGTNPTYVFNEYGNGMTKDPIEIEPSDPNDTMSAASRIRFGKHFPVEWNVKVKDIGIVVSHHMPKLLQYFEEAQGADDDGVLAEQ